MKILKGEIIKRNITFCDETMATNLLAKTGKVVGATALNLREGKFILFDAKAVILATGGASQVYPYTHTAIQDTGDGIAMAYRVGAELIDMEHVSFIPASYWYPDAWRGVYAPAGYSIVSQALKGLPKPRWLNGRGERFMVRYDSERMEATVKDIAGRAIFTEAEKCGSKHGGIYLDWRPLGEHLGEVRSFNLSTDHSLRLAERAGIDPKKELLEAHVMVHTTGGGVRISESCETNIQGLYAAGSTTGGVHGATRTGGSGLIWGLVFGWKAGVHAAEYAMKTKRIEIDSNDVESERDRLYDLLKRPVENGIRPAQIMKRLREETWSNLNAARNKEGLEAALGSILELSGVLPRIYVRSDTTVYNLEWVDAICLENMLLAAEAIARAALMRTESRGSHYRTDHPRMDNKNWLRNIVIRNDKGKMQLYTVPFVITRYKPRGN